MALLGVASEVGAKLLKLSIVKFSSRGEHFFDRLRLVVGSDSHDLTKVDPLLVALLNEFLDFWLLASIVHDFKFLGRWGRRRLLEAVFVVELQGVRFETGHGG